MIQMQDNMLNVNVGSVSSGVIRLQFMQAYPVTTHRVKVKGIETSLMMKETSRRKKTVADVEGVREYCQSS